MAAKKKPAAKAAKKTAAKKPATSASKSSRSAAKKPTPPRAALAAAVTVIHQIPLASIERDTQQPREHFPDAEIQLLADDIRLRGVQQPITVRQAGEDRYIIVTGERRWLASQIAEAATIPAFIVADAAERPELQRLLDQTKENTLRQDLTLIEKAKVLRRLRDDHGVKVGELPALAKSCGLGDMSRSHVSNMIRLTELPQWAQDKINAGEWTFTHGKHLLVAADVPDVLERIRELVSMPFDQANKLSRDYDLWYDHADWTAAAVEQLVDCVFDELYPDASFTESWHRPEERVFYDPAKHPELNLREVSVNGRGTRYILNRELHEKLNAEARADHDAKEARKQKQLESRKANAAAKKGKGGDAVPDEAPAKPTRVSDQTLQAHLHAWLRETLLEQLTGTQHAAVDSSTYHDSEAAGIFRAIGTWAALGAPTCSYSSDNQAIAGAGRDVLEKQGIIDLLDVLESDANVRIELEVAAARNAIQAMSLSSTVALAKHLRLDLDSYRLTDEFLKMLTITGLDELADVAGDASIKAIKKAKDKRGVLLQFAAVIGMPTILRALYEQELEEIEQNRKEIAERGPLCSHCGEYNCEDTCPGAMAARGNAEAEATEEAEA